MVDSAVRAMTWNIWWRFGPRWQDRQPAIRQTLERLDPDVVALQEVWASSETTQADELAEALDLHAVFGSPSYPPAPTDSGIADHEGIGLGHCAAESLAGPGSPGAGHAGAAPQLGADHPWRSGWTIRRVRCRSW